MFIPFEKEVLKNFPLHIKHMQIDKAEFPSQPQTFPKTSLICILEFYKDFVKIVGFADSSRATYIIRGFEALPVLSLRY